MTTWRIIQYVPKCPLLTRPLSSARLNTWLHWFPVRYNACPISTPMFANKSSTRAGAHNATLEHEDAGCLAVIVCRSAKYEQPLGRHGGVLPGPAPPYGGLR